MESATTAGASSWASAGAAATTTTASIAANIINFLNLYPLVKKWSLFEADPYEEGPVY